MVDEINGAVAELRGVMESENPEVGGLSFSYVSPFFALLLGAGCGVMEPENPEASFGAAPSVCSLLFDCCWVLAAGEVESENPEAGGPLLVCSFLFQCCWLLAVG